MPSIKCATCGNRILLPTPVDSCANCGTKFTGTGPSSTGTPVPFSTSTPLPPLPPPPPPPTSSTPPTPTTVARPTPPLPTSPTKPAGMPGRAPDLEGKIVAPPIRDTIERPSDWSHFVLRALVFPFLFPFLIRSIFATSKTPKPTMTVNVVRVERFSDRTIGEARFEGDLISGIPGLGDHVSLWGSRRSGTIIVKRAYNHGTGAQINIRPSSMVWLSRIAAIVLPIIIAVLLVLFAPLIPVLINTVGTLLVGGFVVYMLVIFFVPWIPRRIVPFIVGIFWLYAILSVCAHAGSPPHP